MQLSQQCSAADVTTRLRVFGDGLRAMHWLRDGGQHGRRRVVTADVTTRLRVFGDGLRALHWLRDGGQHVRWVVSAGGRRRHVEEIQLQQPQQQQHLNMSVTREHKINSSDTTLRRRGGGERRSFITTPGCAVTTNSALNKIAQPLPGKWSGGLPGVSPRDLERYGTFLMTELYRAC